MPADQPLIATSRKQLADTFGVTLASIDKWIQEGMPGGPGDYRLKEIIAWRKSKPKYGGEFGDDDPDVNGSSQDVKDRVALARAKLLEHDLEIRLGSFVHRDVMQTQLMSIANKIRKGVERCRKLYGNPPADVVEESLGEADEEINALFDAGRERGPSPLHGELPGSETPDDAPIRA